MDLSSLNNRFVRLLLLSSLFILSGCEIEKTGSETKIGILSKSEYKKIPENEDVPLIVVKSGY